MFTARQTMQTVEHNVMSESAVSF